ncbi:MAG: pyrimidine/purine nucleoside phosphorylase [Leptospiraceae bacterium]|nr:pyrimidine/purine nucleoside phosphorylase [Leptospiraceae bacterium]MCP5496441.1 pyrimidine/purine nucleoside phosphorylase [Leptospiraceae bacterium]
MLKINEYFEGKVKSIAFQAEDTNATAGVISVGEYSFDTSKKEVITISYGKLQVKLPGKNWETFTKGQSFSVDAGVVFDVKAEKDVAYICLYY